MNTHRISPGEVPRIKQGYGSILNEKVITKFEFYTDLRANRRNVKKVRYMTRKVKGLEAEKYILMHNKDKRLKFTVDFGGNTKTGMKAVEGEINDVFLLMGRLWHGKHDKRFLRWRK